MSAVAANASILLSEREICISASTCMFICTGMHRQVRLTLALRGHDKAYTIKSDPQFSPSYREVRSAWFLASSSLVSCFCLASAAAMSFTAFDSEVTT